MFFSRNVLNLNELNVKSILFFFENIFQYSSGLREQTFSVRVKKNNINFIHLHKQLILTSSYV